MPLPALSGAEVDLLMRLHTAAESTTAVAAFGELPVPFVALACRVAGYVGHTSLTRGGLDTLCRVLGGAEPPSATLLGEADIVPAALQARVQSLLAEPSLALLAEVGAEVAAACTAAVAEQSGGGGGIVEALDFDTLLALLAALDPMAALRLVSTSLSTCSVAFDGGNGDERGSWHYKSSFRVWVAVLQPGGGSFNGSFLHAAMEEVVGSLYAEKQVVAVSGGGGGSAGSGWGNKLIDIIPLAQTLAQFTTHVSTGLGDVAMVTAKIQWIAEQVRDDSGTFSQ